VIHSVKGCHRVNLSSWPQEVMTDVTAGCLREAENLRVRRVLQASHVCRGSA